MADLANHFQAPEDQGEKRGGNEQGSHGDSHDQECPKRARQAFQPLPEPICSSRSKLSDVSQAVADIMLNTAF